MSSSMAFPSFQPVGGGNPLSFRVRVVPGLDGLQQVIGGQIQNVRRQHGRRGIQGLERDFFVNLHFCLLVGFVKTCLDMLRRKKHAFNENFHIVGKQVEVFRLIFDAKQLKKGEQTIKPCRVICRLSVVLLDPFFIVTTKKSPSPDSGTGKEAIGLGYWRLPLILQKINFFL